MYFSIILRVKFGKISVRHLQLLNKKYFIYCFSFVYSLRDITFKSAQSLRAYLPNLQIILCYYFRVEIRATSQNSDKNVSKPWRESCVIITIFKNFLRVKILFSQRLFNNLFSNTFIPSVSTMKIDLYKYWLDRSETSWGEITNIIEKNYEIFFERHMIEI